MTEFKAMLRISEEDENLLAAQNAKLLPLIPSLVDDLYEYIMSFPELAALLADPVARQKHRTALANYLATLAAGRYDDEYIAQRRKIGATHFRVGLKPDRYLAAYCRLFSLFVARVDEHTAGDAALCRHLLQTLLKVTVLDVQLALETYFDASMQALESKKQLADSALRIFARTASVSGERFFEALVRSMMDELGMPYVYIIELPQGMRGPHRALAASRPQGPPIPDQVEWIMVERCLADGSKALIVPQGVRAAFPESTWLRAADAEALGVALLFNSSGTLIGFIAVADTQPVRDEMRLATLLPLFCARAAMEIERIRFEYDLSHQATHDALTGLPNRVLMSDRLTHELIAAERRSRSVAIMFVDLDDFKDVNDCFGHDMGDRLLIEVANRLKAELRDEDTVVRYGGDEFVVIAGDLENPADAEVVAGKLTSAIERPVEVGKQRFHCRASIGIALYPQDGRDEQTLLRNADIALYRAKDSHDVRCKFFTTDMNAELVRRVTIEDQLRLACERDEFLLHYQPQFDLASGNIVGVEALLRWQHPRRGIVPPGEFVAVAESCGLIVRIGEWVVEQACRDLARWRNAGHTRLRLAVNVSPRQFENRAIFDVVLGCLDRHGLPHEQFEIEVTESLLIANPEATKALLGAFREQGILISMDDFGTGYSSLSYLKQYPIQRLKIDRSFVRDIVVDPNDAAIVQAIIAMAGALDIDVIAEGIESAAQCERLIEWGCREAQGYYLGYPVTAGEISQALAAAEKGNRALEM